MLAVVAFLGAIASTVALASAVKDVSKDLDRALGNSTQQVLAQDLGVAIGSYASEALGFGVQDGQLTVTAYVSDLGAGQSDEVEMFEFVSGKDAAKLENATFRVIEGSAY